MGRGEGIAQSAPVEVWTWNLPHPDDPGIVPAEWVEVAIFHDISRGYRKRENPGVGGGSVLTAEALIADV